MADKRRRDEADAADNASDDPGAIRQAHMVLQAQHRGLATNLYSYKARVAELEAKETSFQQINTTMDRALTALHGGLLVVSFWWCLGWGGMKACLPMEKKKEKSKMIFLGRAYIAQLVRKHHRPKP
jgi:hypothetical protein